MQKKEGIEETAQDVAGKIFGFCKSFAENCDGKIVLGHDSDSVSSAAVAICAAAISFSGKRCIYFKNQPKVVTRSAVKTYRASGGVHVYTDELGLLCVSFIDKNGENSNFSRGEMVFKPHFSAVGIIPMTGYKYHYIRNAVSECENLHTGFKILVSVKKASMRETLKALLDGLGCEYSFYTGNINQNDKKDIEKFAKSVFLSGFDAGVFVDATGETAIVADKNGKTAKHNQKSESKQNRKADVLTQIVESLEAVKTAKQKGKTYTKQKQNIQVVI